MRAVFLLFSMSILGVFPAIAGSAIDMRGSRTLRVTGEINISSLKLAGDIEQLSAVSKEPINLIINSPGGSVVAGMQLVESLHIAQERGVKIRCAVTNLAASMAFILLAECDEKYALSNSLLLFHPARAMLMFAALRAEDARYMAEELEAINTDACERLESSMGVVTAAHKAWFNYHFEHETLWSASRLVKQVPRKNWLTVVPDILTDKALFSNLNGSDDEQAAVRNFLQNRRVP